MKKILLTLSLAFCALVATAQFARVQVIHNSPTPGTSAGPVVDIYVNGLLLPQLTAVPFRAATPFLDVPAGFPITVDVKVSPSTIADPAVATFDLGALADNGVYVVTANGIVGDPMTPFTLAVNGNAKEAADQGSQVEFAVLHGSPDAPNVDVDVRLVGNVLADVAYGDYSGYLAVDPGVYYVDVRAAGDPNIVATFQADLSGLAGGAATVFASGLLTNSPAFGLFAALPDGTVVELPVSPVARVQIIHNSPSPTVDVYVNGGLLLSNFAFRTATPFIFVPAEVALDIVVVPAGGNPATDDVLNGNPITLTNGETYVVTASGVVGDPTTPFGLAINVNGKEGATDSDQVEFAVLHGSPDAPAVDVDVRTVGNLLSGLAYGLYSPYVAVAPGVYYVDVRAAGDPNIVATFQADLSGLAGGAATVFASGFLGSTPGFGLFAALPDGTVIELPLSPVARLQLVHNSPSPTVDVYANGGLLLSNFEFRTATPFIFVPAETPIEIDVVPAGGNPATDDVYNGGPITLTNGQTYVVVANGIAGSTDFPFTLAIQESAFESNPVSNDEVALNVLHGSPGAPGVDVLAQGLVTGTVASNLTYGEFSGYLSIPAGPYFIQISTPVGAPLFYGDLSGLGGNAVTVFASGILSGNPAFGLFAALADGTVVEIPLVEDFAEVNIIHNCPSPAAAEVDVYLNGALVLDDFAFRTATGFGPLPAGVPLQIAVAPANSASVADTIASFSFPAGLVGGENYVITAGGTLEDPGFPFTLQVTGGALLEASNPDQVSFNVLHSSPGAPAVDVVARTVGTLVSGLTYGTYTGYLTVDPSVYYLDIQLAGTGVTLVTAQAPLDLFEGQALTVFASGLVSGSPEFGLFAADAFGNVYELPFVTVSRAQIIHNSPSPTVDIYFNDELAVPGLAFRQATPFVFVPAEEAVNVKVVPAGGNPATDAVFDQDVTFGENGDSYVVMATGIVQDPTTPFSLALYEGARESAGSGVDLLLYHGSTDAPEVDVVVDGSGAVLFDNVAYGEFSSDYENVPASEYTLNVTPADDNATVVVSYGADLSGLDGGAAVVFASGFLSGSDPAFGVWVALPDGTTFALPVIISTEEQLIGLSEFGVFPNLVAAGNSAALQLNLESALAGQIVLLDTYGRQVSTVSAGTFAPGLQNFNVETAGLTAGSYYAVLITEKGVATRKFQVVK